MLRRSSSAKGMSSPKTHLSRLVENSAVIGAAKKIARLIAAADARVAADIQWRPEDQKRERDRFANVASTSWIVRTLESYVSAFASAWNGAAVRRLADWALTLPVEDRSRMIGVILVTAVLTHIVILALLGEPVHALGWSTRVGLLAAGVFAFRWPEVFAAAWRDKHIS